MKTDDEMDGKLDMNFNTISNVKFPDSDLDAINNIYLKVTMKTHEISIENLVKIANVVSVIIGRNPDLQKYADYFNRMYISVVSLSTVFNEVFEGKDTVNEIEDFTHIKDLQVVIIAVNEELYSQVHYVILSEFCGEFENYTFLESLLYKQSEKQCFHLPRVLYGRHLGFYKMAAIQNLYINISAP